jgi:hypothetical protein
MPNNLGLINNLNKELEKNDIEVTSYIVDQSKNEYSFIFDCVKHIQYYINMKGMRVYSIKSRSKRTKYNREQKSIEVIKVFQAIITILIFVFMNLKIMKLPKKRFEIIDDASKSGEGHCNSIF